jgi:cell division protein FtsI/penicillin-binding protein 2
MGYVWIASKEDEERIKGFGRVPADYVGKGGLEAFYEQELMGSPGETR